MYQCCSLYYYIMFDVSSVLVCIYLHLYDRSSDHGEIRSHHTRMRNIRERSNLYYYLICSDRSFVSISNISHAVMSAPPSISFCFSATPLFPIPRSTYNRITVAIFPRSVMCVPTKLILDFSNEPN